MKIILNKMLGMTGNRYAASYDNRATGEGGNPALEQDTAAPYARAANLEELMWHVDGDPDKIAVEAERQSTHPVHAVRAAAYRAAMEICDKTSHSLRLAAILRLRDTLHRADWWRLLGVQGWSLFDTPSSEVEIVRNLLQCAEPWERQAMMLPEEVKAWNRLPDEFAVYRGYGPNNGLIWELSASAAEDAASWDPSAAARSPMLIGWARKATVVVNLELGDPLIIAPSVKVFAKLPRVSIATL